MRMSVKGHVRDALITAALFGGAAMFGNLGPAWAQATAPKADQNAAQPGSKPDQNAAQEPSAKGAAPTAPGPEIFANGVLTVPGAPTDTSTAPAKFSQKNDALDQIPTMAHGPALSDAQRKLILDTVKASSGAPARVAAGPATVLPLGDEMQAWPQDVVQQIPDLGGTKFVKLADKVLVVLPENRIVIEEIAQPQ